MITATIWLTFPRRFGSMQGVSTIRLFYLLLGVISVACSVTSASAQIDSSPFSVQSARAQQMVSVNQLITPERAQRATEQARKAFLLGRFEQADQLAKRALDTFPHSANALTIEGLLRMKEGKDLKALQIFQEAIHADPALGVAYLAMGEVYNSQGRFKEALVPLDRAVIFLPDTWSVYYETARARLGIGDFQSGLTEITQGEEFVRGDRHAKAALSLLRGVAHFHMKDYVRARQYLNQAISGDPKGPYAVYAENALERVGPFLITGK